MWKLFNSPDKQRRKALASATHEVMREYLSRPFVSSQAPWNEVEIVSLDFETTGLEADRHEIISYGCVIIQRGLIRLGSASHEIVRAEGLIPEESAVIHHITDDQARQGRPLAQALPELLNKLAGRVMLVHFNRIEQGFLNAACQRLYGSPFLIPTIDTLVLAERVLMRRNHALDPHRLRLFNLRSDFKLPKYKAHNALNDALTTAELFLALEAEITPRGSTRLKDLII